MNIQASGVLVVNKPSGPSSHDVVAQARRLFGTRTIGHAGTLDPMASGVLLLLVEEATKLSALLTLEEKSYRATVRFGSTTDSDDAQGIPIDVRPVVRGWLTCFQLETALDFERNRREQVPPRVSAIKQDGVRAYKKHRRGESVDIPARPVRVHELLVLAQSDDEVTLSLSVSKGYYVRSLARDLGARLGMPAHLAALCRTSSGCFKLAEASPWPTTVIPQLLDLTRVVKRTMPTRQLTSEGVLRARWGQQLRPEHFHDGSDNNISFDESVTAAWLAEDDSLVALGCTETDGTSRVVRGFGCQR